MGARGAKQYGQNAVAPRKKSVAENRFTASVCFSV